MIKINLEDLLVNHISLSNWSCFHIQYLINFISSPMYKLGFRIILFLKN
jgi:hypothetical protein